MYADQRHIFDKLPNELAGKLVKHLFSYVNDESPVHEELIIEVAFESIKQQLKRDLESYDKVRAERSKAGKLGGRPKKAKKAIGLFEKQIKANKADSVNVNDNEINISFDTFWNLYNKKTDRKKSEAKWIKLSNKDRENIMQTLPRYIESTPDAKFRKNPSTYLNNESWKDEIIGVPERKQLNAKLKYATPTEMLPHFDNEQAMNDSLQSNTYVSNLDGDIFPLRRKDGTRDKEGDYIIGKDKQLYKITV